MTRHLSNTAQLASAALFYIATTHSAFASINEVPPIYGPPYKVPTSYPYGVTGAPTVSAAIAEWWPKYLAYWRVNCSYSLVLYSRNQPTQASMNLGGGCGGGDGVVGTASCPRGFTLSNSKCLRNDNEQEDKTRGASCNDVGNPINASNGNKYQMETDYSTGDPTPITVTRYYNSNNNSMSLLGQGWNWNHFRRLTPVTVGSTKYISLEQGDGKILYAVLDNNIWRTDEDINIKLSTTSTGYTAVYSEGTKEEYDTTGNLLKSTDLHGNSTSYTYDSTKAVASICNASAGCLTVQYDSSHRMTGLKRNNASVITYQYDTANRLTSIKYLNGSEQKYTYEDTRFPYALTGIIDPKGVRFATFVYDSNGKAIQTYHANEQENYRFSYDSDLQTTITSPRDKKTIISYEMLNGVKKAKTVAGQQSINCAAANMNYEYDSNGYPSLVTDWKGNQTAYTYDPDGHLLKEVQAFDTPAPITVEYEWHATLPVITKKVEAARITNYQFDAQGNQLGQIVTPR